MVANDVETALKAATETDGDWWRRNVTKLVLLVPVLVAAVAIAARAACLSAGVVVADGDLSAGQTLQAEDLRMGWRRPAGDYFKHEREAIGLVLARDVRGRQPVRHGDVLRPQVVATRDIPPETVLGAESVDLAWTPFREGAAEAVAAVVGRQLQRGARSGDVLLAGLLAEPRAGAAEADRAVFSLPVAAGGVAPAVQAGDRVSLLFVLKKDAAPSPAPSPGTPVSVDDAIVRAVTHGTDGATIVVAVRRADEDRIRRLLGISDIFVYTPAPP
jgi:flagella basal body P-ring formation protein FlgA